MPNAAGYKLEYKSIMVQEVSTTVLAVSMLGGLSKRFIAPASSLSTDELYWITVTPTTDKLGFNDSCTDRKEQRLYSGVTSISYALSLYGCGVTTGNVEVKVYRVYWPANFISVNRTGKGNTSFDFNLGAFNFDIDSSRYARQFRVTAVNASELGTATSTAELENSDPSETIVLIDTPIIRADGNNGQAALKWVPIERILGPAYSGGRYSLRYGKFGDYNPPDAPDATFQHSDVGWQPRNLGSLSILDADTNGNPISGTTYTITSVSPQEIYAVQLIYATNNPALPARVYAGRYVYVYPSSTPPVDPYPEDDYAPRVATFPLENRLPATSRNFGYRICEGTFPADTRAAWRNLIVHAFEQWELATDGLVTMTHEGSQCADHSAEHSSAVAKMQQMTSETLTSQQSKMVESFIGALSTYTYALAKDRELNEITSIDETVAPHRFYGKIAASSETSQVFGFLDCTNTDIAGCALYDPKSHTTDIFLNVKNLGKEERHLVIPDDHIWHPRKGLVFPDACMLKSPAYETLVHESGHAVGIGGGEGASQAIRGHSFIPYSIVNYDSLVYVNVDTIPQKASDDDCAPYQFDIMAIFALYQTAQ